jgi:hypothetical protein
MPEPIRVPASRPEPEFEAYLDTLVSALDLPILERGEVRDEIAMHLRDARDEAIAAGATDPVAAAEALRRFGDPTHLARDLSEARQRRSALLAAVGAGTWAAAGGAVRGFILGIALVLVVSFAIALAGGMVYWAGLVRSWDLSDQGWTTAFWGAALWLAAWQGARSFVSTAARRIHRRAERVRPFVAVAAGAIVAWLSLVWLQAAQNLASVIVLALVPVLFAAGALTGTDRPIAPSKQARRASLALFVTVAIAVPLIVTLAATPVRTELSATGPVAYDSMEELLAAKGFDMPGRFVPDPPEFGTTGWTIDHGVVKLILGRAAIVTARWRDLRVEAWRADLDTGSLDRSHRSPFATAPMDPDGHGLLSGSVHVDRTRDVSGWWLVVTGQAPDGGRDLVVSLGGTNTSFTGSALDWLTAP